jgi:hypothetical protein
MLVIKSGSLGRFIQLFILHHLQMLLQLKLFLPHDHVIVDISLVVVDEVDGSLDALLVLTGNATEFRDLV